MKNILYILIFVVVVSCDNYNRVVDSDRDITPPILKSLKADSVNSIVLSFSEDVNLIESLYISREKLNILTTESSTNSLRIEFLEELTPGREYCSEFTIEDLNGNTLSFISLFYGYNPEIPGLLINEFTCKGTKTNPDKVELYVTKSGNMAGVTLYNGVSSNNDSMFIFPSIDVHRGDYIVIRAITERYPTECIEISDLNVDNDRKFIDGVRDIRTAKLNLSSTNGVFTIYNEPFGYIIDSVAYSKNINNSEKSNRNFGLKKVVERIDILQESGGWIGAEDLIFPNDTVNVDRSTTTRSLNRNSFLDSDSKNDWYLVPTGSYTFGYENSIERY